MSVDVADWLGRLGLGQYAPAFAANDIDGEVLPELTAEDLIGLGVASIGHRRKLLAAIAALRSGATEPVIETPPTGAAAISSEAERRQLTVMFCDLVGSTPLSTRFDPEDLREILGAYHRCVAETVARFAGFVAKYMGDGVLVYFGYPEAHEDDAERAVRAGLALIDAVAGLEAPEPLNVRLGETGERLGPKILDLEQGANLSPGAVGHDQGARPGQRLQAGGKVWRLADDAALLRGARADQIANHDEAGGDADPNIQRLSCGEPADRIDDREPGARRALGVVLMRLRVAEINEHAVAHILRDKTAKAADGVGDTAMVGADDLAQILGIEARRQRRRAD